MRATALVLAALVAAAACVSGANAAPDDASTRWGNTHHDSKLFDKDGDVASARIAYADAARGYARAKHDAAMSRVDAAHEHFKSAMTAALAALGDAAAAWHAHATETREALAEHARDSVEKTKAHVDDAREKMRSHVDDAHDAHRARAAKVADAASEHVAKWTGKDDADNSRRRRRALLEHHGGDADGTHVMTDHDGMKMSSHHDDADAHHAMKKAWTSSGGHGDWSVGSHHEKMKRHRQHAHESWADWIETKMKRGAELRDAARDHARASMQTASEHVANAHAKKKERVANVAEMLHGGKKN